MNNFYGQLCNILSENQILCNEPMSRHTTFRVGGPADYFLYPKLEQAAEVIALCRKEQVPYWIIGNGSNLLVADKGIRGVVLTFTGQEMNPSGIQMQGKRLTVQAGVRLSQTAQAAYRAGLGGLEFAAGIPGTVGGAVVMNAGAYGGELKDIIEKAKVLAKSGKIEILSCEELDLSYRHSCILEREMIVLEAELVLEPKPKEDILAVMEDYKKRRQEKQPLEYPSAGSTFKRPAGHFAGKLIMDAGLAGFTVGGAQVSQKHCGFVINKGNATARDILTLIEQVQQRVRQQFGVSLEPEVKYIGEF